ncbi:MAG: hypothetical protein Q7S59_02835 [Sulfurimonas sp.]|nr:hypothetical protein [Sulfurimonas sp.]
MKKDKNKIQLICIFISKYAVDISKNRLFLYLRGCLKKKLLSHLIGGVNF